MIVLFKAKWDYDGEIRIDKGIACGKNLKRIGEKIDAYYGRDLIGFELQIYDDESTGVLTFDEMKETKFFDS